MRNETCRRRETLSAVSGPIYRTSEDESGRDDETDTNAPLIACCRASRRVRYPATTAYRPRSRTACRRTPPGTRACGTACRRSRRSAGIVAMPRRSQFIPPILAFVFDRAKSRGVAAIQLACDDLIRDALI